MVGYHHWISLNYLNYCWSQVDNARITTRTHITAICLRGLKISVWDFHEYARIEFYNCFSNPSRSDHKPYKPVYTISVFSVISLKIDSLSTCSDFISEHFFLGRTSDTPCNCHFLNCIIREYMISIPYTQIWWPNSTLQGPQNTTLGNQETFLTLFPS